MTTTVDEGRPERVWAVAAVPTRTQESADRPTGTVSPPQRSRRGRHGRPDPVKPKRAPRLRTAVVVVALLAGAGVGGYHVVRERLAAAAFVDIGSVILTAEAVPVGFAEAVVVDSIAVTQHSRVTMGQDLAEVTSAIGRSETLHAPADGTVAVIKVGVGGVARGGEPIIMLYDQARLTFQADVSVAELRRLRLGMTARVDGPGLARHVTATLDHVVPVVGAGKSSGADKLTVVLVPSQDDRATVGALVPGLPFNASIDTNTAQNAVPAVNTG